MASNQSQHRDFHQPERETRFDKSNDHQPGQPPTSPGTEVRSLLVIDPSPLSLLATAGTFHSAGYACVCARNYAAATQAVAKAPHDAFIIDVGSDAVDAVQWLDQIRKSPQHRDVPAVMLADASWAGLELKTERMTVSTRCLFKPIDPHALLAVVDHLLWRPGMVSGWPKRSRSLESRLDSTNDGNLAGPHTASSNVVSATSRGWVTL